MLRRVERFAIHSYDVDAFHALALPALGGFLQEVAGQHARELGCGLEALHDRGLTWVLVRQRIAVPRPILLGDEIAIASWPSGIHPLVVTREFTVTRGDEEVARASTAWLLLDVATRRPVRPVEVLDPAMRPRLEPVAPVAGKLPAPELAAPARRFDVRYADIDVNGHVTNTSYVAWALECVDEARWRSSRPCDVEVHYLAEARLGDAVVARAGEQDGALLHGIARAADGAELARVRTRWAPR
jgi:acyl-ACP thioesterase